jgi:hypothetical protein
MTTSFSNLARALCTAAVLAGGLLAAPHADAASIRRGDGGSIHYYDDKGYDRGYPWCGSASGTTRCDFDTFEQCRASGKPNITCAPNAFSYGVNGGGLRRF